MFFLLCVDLLGGVFRFPFVRGRLKMRSVGVIYCTVLYSYCTVLYSLTRREEAFGSAPPCARISENSTHGTQSDYGNPANVAALIFLTVWCILVTTNHRIANASTSLAWPQRAWPEPDPEFHSSATVTSIVVYCTNTAKREHAQASTALYCTSLGRLL